MSKTRLSLHSNQKGVVSIMITLIMIIVVSLIVLGLAQISRREQRQSLDTHLSSQAFYAAESGVNDVVSILQNLNTGTIPEKNDCDTTGAPAPYNTLVPTISDGVSYSCVIVDPTPGNLVGTVGSTPSVFTLRSSDASALGTVTYSWTPGTGKNGSNRSSCPTTGDIAGKSAFSSVGGWGTCPYAVLRVDLVGVSGGGSRDALLNDTMTVYVVPVRSGGGGSTSYASGRDTAVVGASCTATSCSYSFSGLGSGPYYSRVSGIYTDGDLTISRSGGGSFGGSQVTVDVTGKAQDVLRRIRVAVDLNRNNLNGNIGPAILTGDSTCKRFYITDTGANDGSGGFPGCN